MSKLSAIGAFAVLPFLFLSMQPVFADEAIRPDPVSPYPSPSAVDAASYSNGNPINKPVTGAAVVPGIVGGERPPSLEYLQATRAGAVNGAPGLDQGREDVLHQAGLMYGAQGGLAARAFALNEMLRRYEGALNTVFDFHPVVLRLGGGKTLLRPPIVSQAQTAFALGEGGQVARETACVYSITRHATLASAPPEWRAYLVRDWAWPRRPADAVLPRSEQEVAFWNKYVAEGWAQGEKQAVDIFLSDLGRLERDLIGMARYRVLLRAGVVESPKVAFQDSVVNGGGVELRAGDRIVRITDQKGLKADRSSWPKATRDCPR
jgi:defect-in-organelle-trafficking protein DotC